ncbi:uncharacterized protein OCT59_017376 [Rhizophagus irregularis]|nr:hypothetical protein OCT59_017376 [Rhizophagus irregularis]CAB5140611.1 unnamed protein product [Rhizophagus irregularis]CAB5358985.1 unnamed protein product [Rhizophagus irregularis]
MGDNITLRTKKDDQNHSSKTDDYFPLRDDISCQFITMIPSLKRHVQVMFFPMAQSYQTTTTTRLRRQK